MSLNPGARLGPYEVVAQIGAGGMGEVYRATDTRLGRTVAIKVSRDEFSERFEREARAVAALNHPHICQLYDVGPNYLVMEFVDGGPVEPPRDRARLLDIASQVTDALVAAHAAGIVHRDLKPDNILVSRDGQIKVLDFGLATGGAGANAEALVTQAATAAGTTVGTMAYMSPEQARGEPVDARSDLWSLGVLLYELATGARPFGGPTAAVVFEGILTRVPPPLRDSDAHVPAGLSPIVAKLLEKDRARRYQSAVDVRADLKRLTEPAATAGGAPDASPSIAVLPFANMSGDKEQEYFSDGLAEEIINLLAQVPNLKVTARTSAFAFRGKEQDITTIADVLRVKTILEGSVRKAGSRIRVTAQLINAADGYHIWSQRYDRELTDVFAIQDEIAAAITGALKLKLGPASPHRHTPTMAAYEAYLKYRYYQWSFTPEGAQRSRECLEQALARDPEFALPYVGLADYHLASAVVGGMTADDSMPRARELAQKALVLDPDLPEAHAMLGIVAGQYDLDWAECERRFGLAMAHDVVSTPIREWYVSFCLIPLGRGDEARRQMERVLDDDPLCQMWHFSQAQVFGLLGLTDQAIAMCRRAVELDPQFWLGWWRLGLHLALEGQERDEARSCAERAFASAPWSPVTIGLLAAVLEGDGETSRAAELLDTLRGNAYGAPAGFVCYSLVRGDTDAAVEALTLAVENRFPGILNVVGSCSLLRESARWPTLLTKARLTI